MINLIIISFSLLIILVCYIVFAITQKKWINFFWFSLITFIPANYLLPLFNLIFKKQLQEISLGFLYVYAYYSIFFAFFILSTLFMLKRESLPKIKNFINNKVLTESFTFDQCLKLSLFFLGLGIISALIIFYKIGFSYLSFPRLLYEKTRISYGILYFPAQAFFLLSWVFILFSNKKKMILLFSIILAIFLYFFGSKGAMLNLFLVYVLYIVITEKIKNNIFNVIKYTFLTSFYISILFLIYHPYITQSQITSITRPLENVSSYSDYTKNTVILVDNFYKYFDHHFYGKLLLENTIYSRIPRIIYPEKPFDFGDFKLSKALYPEWHSKHVGDPSFGIFGRVYADFGPFGFIWGILVAVIKGIFLGAFYQLFKEYQTPQLFIAISYLSGVPIFSLPPADTFFENIFILPLLLYAINLFFRKFLEKGK